MEDKPFFKIGENKPYLIGSRWLCSKALNYDVIVGAWGESVDYIFDNGKDETGESSLPNQVSSLQ